MVLKSRGHFIQYRNTLRCSFIFALVVLVTISSEDVHAGIGEKRMKMSKTVTLARRWSQGWRSTKYGGWAFAILHVILKALLVDDALKLPSVTSIYDLMHFGVLFREAPTFLFLNFAGGAYLSGTLSSFCSRR